MLKREEERWRRIGGQPYIYIYAMRRSTSSEASCRTNPISIPWGNYPGTTGAAAETGAAVETGPSL